MITDSTGDPISYLLIENPQSKVTSLRIEKLRLNRCLRFDKDGYDTYIKEKFSVNESGRKR